MINLIYFEIVHIKIWYNYFFCLNTIKYIDFIELTRYIPLLYKSTVSSAKEKQRVLSSASLKFKTESNVVARYTTIPDVGNTTDVIFKQFAIE